MEASTSKVTIEAQAKKISPLLALLQDPARVKLIKQGAEAVSRLRLRSRICSTEDRQVVLTRLDIILRKYTKSDRCLRTLHYLVARPNLQGRYYSSIASQKPIDMLLWTNH
jgi:hypothetical protein